MNTNMNQYTNFVNYLTLYQLQLYQYDFLTQHKLSTSFSVLLCMQIRQLILKLSADNLYLRISLAGFTKVSPFYVCEGVKAINVKLIPLQLIPDWCSFTSKIPFALWLLAQSTESCKFQITFCEKAAHTTRRARVKLLSSWPYFISQWEVEGGCDDIGSRFYRASGFRG